MNSRSSLAALLLIVALLGCKASERKSKVVLTGDHREAIYNALNNKNLPQPNDLEITDSDVLVATYQLDAPPPSPRRFAEDCLMAIRNAMYPYKVVENYRVTVNGPSPGPGMIRRYGSALLAGLLSGNRESNNPLQT